MLWPMAPGSPLRISAGVGVADILNCGFETHGLAGQGVVGPP